MGVPTVPTLSENQPLAPLTSLGTGGSARWFCEPSSEQQVAEALAWAKASGVRVFILGGGSNLVVADEGFEGLVLRIGLLGVDFEDRGEVTRINAQAGHPWDALVELCCKRGLSGLECLSGIPGTVGATPVQNVGAYGQDVAQTIVQVRCLERETGQLVTFDNAACEFGYRDSRFKRRDVDRYVVLGVTFELSRSQPAPATYPELRQHLERELDGQAPTVAQLRRAVLQLRASKSMLLDPSDPNGRSCGSFFVNPVLSRDAFSELSARAAPASPPTHPEPDGRVKVPAAWLIQNAGFERGVRQGHVGLSSKHALCVVAHAGASSAEVMVWARHIQKTVRERYGINLEPEPQFLGATF